MDERDGQASPEPEPGATQPEAEAPAPAPRKRRLTWPRLLAIVLGALVLLFMYRATRSAPAEETTEGARPPGGAVFEVQQTSTEVFLECSDCHEDLDRSIDPGLPTFTHDVHFGNGVSDCAACHSGNTHEPDKVNKPTMVRCYWCHGEGEQYVAPGKCTTCHPADYPDQPSSHGQSDWVRVHGVQAVQDPLDCATCHQESFCKNCHSVPMPHPDDWNGEPHVLSTFETDGGQETCGQCHQMTESKEKPRDFCDQCHHEWGPKNTQWIKYHPEVVKDTAQPCFECHAAQTCATCHVNGVEDLSADETKWTQASNQ